MGCGPRRAPAARPKRYCLARFQPASLRGNVSAPVHLYKAVEIKLQIFRCARVVIHLQTLTARKGGSVANYMLQKLRGMRGPVRVRGADLDDGTALSDLDARSPFSTTMGGLSREA